MRLSLHSAFKPGYALGVQLRYNYRLYPSPGQQHSRARAFGCARVVYNYGLRARQEAYARGLPYICDAELSARLTAAKATPERAWLGEVSAVVLQQALADLNTAYRYFFASVTGKRKGQPIAPHVRAWQCHGCGAWLDRDINAAVNVAKAAGLAVTACGARVSPGAIPARRSEAGTHPKPRREAA